MPDQYDLKLAQDVKLALRPETILGSPCMYEIVMVGYKRNVQLKTAMLRSKVLRLKVPESQHDCMELSRATIARTKLKILTLMTQRKH